MPALKQPPMPLVPSHPVAAAADAGPAGRGRAAGAVLRAAALVAVAWLCANSAFAQSRVDWQQLSPAEQHVLAPLQGQWASLDGTRQAKWREVAARYPSMSPEERQRVRERMPEWASMSARERGEARLRYQEATQLPESERRARWEAYQALSAQQRQELAARAAREAHPPQQPRQHRQFGDIQPKSNIVGGSVVAPSTRAVAPGVVQSGPGATTRPITRLPAPPPHQQAGMPKIAATPGFVDSATLLPRRGPQGAAIERRGERAIERERRGEHR